MSERLPEETIRYLEREWNDLIRQRAVARMEEFLADGYFLAVAVEGRPLLIAPRAQWLKTLEVYRIESLSIDDMQVHIYGDTAVVAMLYTQKATMPGERDISGHFMLTDIWIKTSKGWRVAERHSSRAEKLPSPPEA